MHHRSLEESGSILNERRSIWRSKKILRRLYHKWHSRIQNELVTGKTLELGGGSGNLKERIPTAISSDVVYAPWLDLVLDAHDSPFVDQSFDNIVLFDVLHHLEDPDQFFRESERILKNRGRIILMEPNVSCLSFFVYKFIHQEGMVWNSNPFKMHRSNERPIPFQGNQAIPSLIFGKYRDHFLRKHTSLKIIIEELSDFLIYPLSGGFHNPSLCPEFLFPLLDRMEKFLNPLRRLMAFRMFVVLEKDESRYSHHHHYNNLQLA